MTCDWFDDHTFRRVLFFYLFVCCCFYSCFLDQWPLIFGVIVPAAIVVLTNTVVFVLVIRQLMKSIAVTKSEKLKRRQNLKRARNAFSIMTLTGLTWSLGFLSLIYVLNGPIQWLFTVVNSTQGFMIFVLYCLRHPIVVSYWKRRLPCCAIEPPTYTPSSNSQFQSSYSTSKGFVAANVPLSSVEENRYVSCWWRISRLSLWRRAFQSILR